MNVSIWMALSCAGIALAQTPARQPADLPATAPPVITLKGALLKARQFGGQYQAANLALLQAQEDTKQAKAARLPSLSALNQFIYTEGNGTPSGVFVANDGVHVYNEQAVAHEDLGLLLRSGEQRRALAAEAVARYRVEIAARGTNAIVIQNYYATVSSQRRLANLQRSVAESKRFLDLTSMQERGGEVAHADVIKAQLDLQQRQRDLKEAQLAIEKAKIALGVILFPDYNTAFTVEDDLEQPDSLPELGEASTAAASTSPDLKAANASVQQAGFDVTVSRYALLPTFSLDLFYGIDANQFAFRTQRPPGAETPYRQNLGYSAQTTLTIPVWNWGATRSKIKQAEMRRQQAQLDLSLAQKNLRGNVAAAYAEARMAFDQLDSLHGSADLAAESLRLTVLRYQAGESTALEVVDAQNTLNLARNAYDDGRTRYRVALAILETLMGAL